MSDEVAAIVRVVDGQLVLDDPGAAAMVAAVARHNCRGTLAHSAERVAHFVRRLDKLKLSAETTMIVILNVDDAFGGELANILMPGADWQKYRDAGAVPFARGLCTRLPLQASLEKLDPAMGRKLRNVKGVAVLVADHGTIDVFDLRDKVALPD